MASTLSSPPLPGCLRRNDNGPEADAAALRLLADLAASCGPLVAKQMLHQGLEEAMAAVRANRPQQELRRLADVVMAAVLDAAALQAAEQQGFTAAAPLPLTSGSSAMAWAGRQGDGDGSGPSATRVVGAGLARPLEREFALAVKTPASTLPVSHAHTQARVHAPAAGPQHHTSAGGGGVPQPAPGSSSSTPRGFRAPSGSAAPTPHSLLPSQQLLHGTDERFLPPPSGRPATSAGVAVGHNTSHQQRGAAEGNTGFRGGAID